MSSETMFINTEVITLFVATSKDSALNKQSVNNRFVNRETVIYM